MAMKYSVGQTSDGLRVDAAVPVEQQAKLLVEFAKCAAGTCSCPSTQYEKLASINVKQTDVGVSVDLKAKDGETIDQDDIARCLDHTANLINP